MIALVRVTSIYNQALSRSLACDGLGHLIVSLQHFTITFGMRLFKVFKFDNQKSALSGGVFLSLIYCPDVTSSETEVVCAGWGIASSDLRPML